MLFDSTRSLMVVRRRGILALLDAAIVAALLAPETDATAAEAAFPSRTSMSSETTTAPAMMKYAKIVVWRWREGPST